MPGSQAAADSLRRRFLANAKSGEGMCFKMGLFAFVEPINYRNLGSPRPLIGGGFPGQTGVFSAYPKSCGDARRLRIEYIHGLQ